MCGAYNTPTKAKKHSNGFATIFSLTALQI
jgi:hypothetical protein